MDDQALRTDVAWACRILAMEGHNDFTLGHVSARRDANLVLIKRFGIGLDEVTPDDILTIDMDRRKVAGNGAVHLEAVLHTEAYKSRAELGAVIHTHPPYATAIGAVEATLKMLCHDAVLFKDGLPIFAETAELITQPHQGQAVVRALGPHHAVLLRNHGVLVVGRDVPSAIFAAISLERAARFQAIASALGPLRPMEDMDSAMADRLYPSKVRQELVNNYWHYLIRQARQRGFAAGMPA